MSDLHYRRDGGPPDLLPFSAVDDAGQFWTDLPNNPAGVAACGFVPGPSKPQAGVDYDPAAQVPRWDEVAEAWMLDMLPPPPPPTKADLNAYAEGAFNTRRDGGVTLPNGLRIKTDGESRGLINGAYSLADVRPELVIDFRASGGWVDVDTATMQTVAVAVGLWVQACYSAWRRCEEAIETGTHTTFVAIDAAVAAVTLPS